MDFPKGSIDLYVTHLSEPADNELRIVVAEGVLGEQTDIKFAGHDLGQGRPIEITNASRSFVIKWDSYVTYAVRNESYWKEEAGEPPLGDHLDRRHGSAFQRYVSETTFADDEYPGPLEHWSLTTLNHIVDVISVGPPRVTKVHSSE
ncbi:hypothetical protein [Parasphingorhabdus sp.]|uniref:hypothetical protein n=1 Tax=Parasphingorhabdus sp. TaxID=2709688 RepID=UPI003A8CC347